MRHMVHSCAVNPQFFILFLSKPLNLRKRKICNFSSRFQYISTKQVKRKCVSFSRGSYGNVTTNLRSYFTKNCIVTRKENRSDFIRS